MYSGAEFEEDILEALREKQAYLPFTEDPKLASDRNMRSQIDGEDTPQQHRLRLAHRQYHSQDYASASVSYEKCLQGIPVSDVPNRQLCMENLSRSLLYMGNYPKALEWALKLDAAATDSRQKINSLNLLASVCHALGKYEEELEALHSCLDTQRSNPHLWFRIANCYGGLFKIPLSDSTCIPFPVPSCCAFKSRLCPEKKSSQNSLCHEATINEEVACDDEAEKVCPNDGVVCLPGVCEVDCRLHSQEYKSCSRPIPSTHNDRNLSCDIVQQIEKCDICTLAVQMISTCLLCARLNLGDCEESPLGPEKHSQMNEKITDCLNHMEVDQTFIDEASQMLLINQRDTIAYLTSDLKF